MNPVYPCLWFDTQAEEAANFYTTVFKNSEIGTTSRYGKEGFEVHGMPEGTVMSINFVLCGKKFMALNGGPLFKINPSVSFFVNCQSIDQTNETWSKLSEEGKVLMPIDKYPWSERYGWVQDQYGLAWQVSFSREVKEQKITPAILFTGVQFGKAEEAIRLYTSVFANFSIDRLTHYPKESEHGGKILFSVFKLGDYDMIAMDSPEGHDYTFNEALSLVVECETQEQIDYYWDRFISNNGQESQCGWLKDKFGLWWQIVPTILGKLMSDSTRSQRVMKTFLKMKKFDIEKLRQA